MVINKTKFQAIIIMILIFYTIIASGCIKENDQNNNENKNNKSISYLYQITIIPNENIDFYLHIPVPIFYENKSICHDIINDIEIIEGNPKIETRLSNYGHSLNISGIEKIVIHSKGILDFLNQRGPTIVLSMEYENNTINTFSTEKYWLFSNKSNVSIIIELINDYMDGGYYKYISNKTELSKGWQIIDIEEKIKVP